MLPVLLYLGASIVCTGGLIGLISWALKKDQEHINRLGGLSRINAIQLISINYQGKKNTKGPGIPVSAYGHSWEVCEVELKLKAAEANCDIVINVTKSGSKKDGFHFQGIAYQKG